MKRMVIGTLLISFFTFGLVACGGDKSPKKDSATNNEKNTLTMWNGFTGSDGEILEEIVDEFNEKNDKGITIDMDIMTWNNLDEKLPASISTGTAPDFVILSSPGYSHYVNNGAMQSLDDYWDYEGVDQSDFEQSVIDIGKIDDTQYFIPMQVMSFYLYWNKDLFEDAGLDPEHGPQTWDELSEMAVELRDESKNVFGISLPIDNPTLLYSWLLNEGVELQNETRTQMNFASSKTLEVLEKMQNMIYVEKAGPQSISAIETDNLMFAGQLAMQINGPWLNNGLKKNKINYGVSTLPTGTDGTKGAVLESSGFGIPTSTDEDKKEAIYEFIKYWNTPDNVKRWSLQNEFPPYLHSVIEDPEIKEDEIISEFSKQIEYATPFMVGTTQYPTINNDIINPLIESLFLGEDPEELMNHADKEIKQLLSSE